jgi:membrane protein DedA with SNARE-associated domain
VTTTGAVLAALGSTFVLVLLGSIVPIVPTGAVVSATAVVAAHRDLVTPVLVIAVGALAAYLGDGVVYALCRRGGEAVTRRLHLSAKPVRAAEAVRRRLLQRPVTVLLVSRLVPAGRIPVLLAAALVDLPWRRFLAANGPACALWSASYAAIGVLGGSVFPEPWQGVVAVIVLALVVTQIASMVQRRGETATAGGAPAGGVAAAGGQPARTASSDAGTASSSPSSDGGGSRSPSSSSQSTS